MINFDNTEGMAEDKAGWIDRNGEPVAVGDTVTVYRTQVCDGTDVGVIERASSEGGMPPGLPVVALSAGIHTGSHVAVYASQLVKAS